MRVCSENGRKDKKQRSGGVIVSEKMKVLVVEPMQEPDVKEIDAGLKSLQKEVGGRIQALYPFDEKAAVVCNDEGKINGLELNRALRNDNGRIYDIIAGPFLICGLDGDRFGSLPDKLISKFSEQFKQPEMFIQVGREMLALPTEPQKPRDLHIENNSGIINFGSGTNTIIHTHTRQTVSSVTMKETGRGKPSVRKTLEQVKKEQGNRGQPKPPRKSPPEL